jgi:ATP adenylyltransferase
MPSESRPRTYEELAEFIQERMTMSHIYQPLVIRTLIDAGGSATLRQLATALAANDESVLREAEKRIREMPVRVLRKREVIDFDKATGLVTLNTRRLTFEQKARLRALCEQRLGEYLGQRGLATWDYRLIDDSAVPGDLRFQVLADSERRCVLCGATERERPLDVDHILPRSRGGTNERANLQVLCSRCNRAKGNRDTRDFRQSAVESDPQCLFCRPSIAERAVEETGLMLAVPDAAPVTDRHLLVIAKRHTPDFFSLTQAERADADSLLR